MVPGFWATGVIVQEGLFIQVGEYLVNDQRIFNAGDDFDGATAFAARFDIDLELTSSPKQTLKHFCLEKPGTVAARQWSRASE